MDSVRNADGYLEFSRRRMLAGASALAGGALIPRAALGAKSDQAHEPVTVGEAPGKPVDRVKQTVFFCTNRMPTGAVDRRRQFGTERAGVTYGCAKVLVAADRRWRAVVSSEPETVKILSRAETMSAIKRRGAGRRAIVALHGYNNSFDEWLCTGSELVQDLQTDAHVFLVSWSSQEYALGYSRDVNEIEWAYDMVVALLIDLLSNPDIASVEIIAHSVGSRAAVAALKAIFASAKRALLRRVSGVVLAAADIETQVADRDLLPIRDAYRTNTTVYASDKDLMMRISEYWNGRPRVGSISQSIYVRPGITTIDVSAVDQTLIGHSTLFLSDRLANDLHYLVEARLSVERRFHVRPVTIAAGTYWVMT